MSSAGVRGAWLKMRDEVSARAMANKQSQDAVLAMAGRYRSLSDSDRAIVDALLAEQLTSEDETVRFDAIALIADFKISSALPALRRLADWLESQPFPGAPYEWAKANRLIGQLASASEGP